MATTTEIITNSLAQKLFTPNSPPLNFLHCCLFFEVTFWVAPVTDPRKWGKFWWKMSFSLGILLSLPLAANSETVSSHLGICFRLFWLASGGWAGSVLFWPLHF